MAEKETQAAEIIKLFSLALKQCRLYSPTHPAAQLAFRNLLTALTGALSAAGNLTFGFMEGKIVVNDQALDRKQTGVGDLLKECQPLLIESLIFEPGMTEAELSALIRIMSTPPKALQEAGGFKQAFDAEAFQRIRLGTSRYRMIKEEEEVVKKSDFEAGPGEADAKGSAVPRRTVERMEEVIEHGLTGSENEIDFDIERLSYEVERKPESVARQMVRRADNLESLKRIVQDMGRFLREHLARPFTQQGKDFSRTVTRLAKEFKKVVESFDTPEDFRGSVKELVSVLQQCADAVKLELIVRNFEESGGDPKSLARIKAKFFTSKEARERVLEPLKERLLSLGVTESEFDQTFAVEEKRVPKRAQAENGDAEELAELRELKARYEQEIATLRGEMRRAQGHRERLENIIGSLAEGLVVVDNEGKIQMMNPAAEKLLGMKQDAGMGVPIGQSLKAEHIVALTKGPLADESNEVTKEIAVQSIDDETRKILQASSAIIENQAGETVGMVAVLSDITKQKKLDEMKSKFVAHVSHELRTPLLAIDQSLHILLGKETQPLNPEQEQFLEIAERNISRLSRLVNDLLDVAKIEAGEMKLKPIPFRIGELLHHVVETV
ncbi:MAG: PAS domain S-box protein, partial [Deltaproteobacteria bacterium]|nr:PAS domain S-box protein [Deltaproteobacteria bacterium]